MNTDAMILITRQAIVLVLMLSAAPMLASLIVGLFVSLLQAATQVQEQTLSYVPKIAAVFAVIVILGPWMLSRLVSFAQMLMNSIIQVR